MTLKQQAFSGLFWTLSEQFSIQIINFIIQIILARILLPSDFGLIAMIMIFIGLGNALSDSGLTSSLIRTIETDKRDLSTVFFFNLSGSILIYWGIYALAPFISDFYNQPTLTSIIRVFSLTIIIRALIEVQLTILKKELKFKKIMLISLPSVLISGLLGIFLAKQGVGVWSLVWMSLCQYALLAIQVWIKTKWLPELVIDKKKLKYHFNFGYKLSLASILNVIFLNIYNLIIGKWFLPKDLGYYNRADTMQGFPVRNLITAVKKVAYPLLSKIQNNDSLLKSTYRRMMLQVVFWITPLMILLILIAKPMIEVLLTDKWLPAVPYFQLLCISSILYPLQEYNLQILDVKGRSEIYLRIEIIKKILTIFTILMVFPFGIMGLLYGQIILSICFYFISSFLSGKLINYPVLHQVKDIYPILLLSLVTGIVIWLLKFKIGFINQPNIFYIGVTSSVFFFVYLTLSYFFKIPVISDISQFISPYIKRKGEK
ncbi:MAG: lipopolysaccharide biosynthesis protein [Chitinophagaceae bacterium]|nr:lipopolysaccharide biosynthesis protein [Chitinophagaceae bacterium]